MSGRPQQTCGASLTPTPAASSTSAAADADLGMVVVGERVVEQDHAARLEAGALAAGAGAARTRSRTSRSSTPAACAVDRRPSTVSPSQRPAALRASALESGATRLAHFDSVCDVPDRARAERHAVAAPVAGEELALEARDVDADRTLGSCRRGTRGRGRAPRRRPRRRARRRRAARPSRDAACSRGRASSASPRASPCTTGTSCRRASSGTRRGRCTSRRRARSPPCSA